MSLLLTPTAAAKLLAISVKQLRELSTAGEIPSVNIGLGDKRPTRRYLPSDIDEFIGRRRTTAARSMTKETRSRKAPPFYRVIDFEKTLAEIRAAKKKAKADRKRT